MFNPLEFKHDITSRPLKWMWKQYDPQDDITPYALLGMATAVVNLFPAASFIQAGVRGDRMFSHVTYKRFNPWAEPIFHYVTAASKAERIGGKIGHEVVDLELVLMEEVLMVVLVVLVEVQHPLQEMLVVELEMPLQ